ncbi:SAVMC3_10250 family protein [Nonomuraea sp. NPDC003709]|uniref:DUF7019 family protein n=1 Tax=Nonomuraea sp. NPDC003709 TaxID=3154450 RepID=UPI0033B403C4
MLVVEWPINAGRNVSFKYYLYISDAKIDMLLSQIDPGAGHKRGTELGVDLKMLKVKRTYEPSAGDRIARLELVVRHLLDHGDVGSVEEPGQFFWGLLPMRWGPFPVETGSSLVFFGGQTEETTVGLGGSVKHVLGSVPDAADHGIGRSLMPPMLDALGVSSDLEDEYVADAVDGDLDRADSAALAKAYEAVTSLRRPAQNVEFVAKRLLHGKDPRSGESVLLGSPVYVALVD